MSVEAVPTPTELGALKTAAWATVKVASKTNTSTDYTASLAAMRAVKDACELYRRAHHADAREVFVVCDDAIGQPLSVYARVGADVRCVFEAERVA